MDDEVAAELTIGNLLDPSAGFYGDEGFDTGDDDEAIARYVSHRLPHLLQIFPLGASFSYNNAGFTLLGRLIEVAAGTAYNAAMGNLLLGPLGLDDTLLDHAAVLRRPYADGHVALPINGRPAVAVATPLWLPRSVDPAGGIWATTLDVLRLRQALPIPDASLQMGRNWFVHDVAGMRVFGHNGDTLGQHAAFLAIPSQQFALIVLTNGQAGASLAAMAALVQFAALTPLAGKLGLTRVLLAPAGASAVTLSADDLAAYAGRYADPGEALTFTRCGDGLTGTAELLIQPGTWQPAIQPPPAIPAPVTFLAEDMALANGARASFVRDASGRVRWISSGLRLVPRLAGDWLAFSNGGFSVLSRRRERSQVSKRSSASPHPEALR